MKKLLTTLMACMLTASVLAQALPDELQSS